MFGLPDFAVWKGRDDTVDGPNGLRWHQLVQRWDVGGPIAGAPALLGFVCDAGVTRNRGRAGAAEGPRALRLALAGAAAHGLDVVYDCGDVDCEADSLESAQQNFARGLQSVLDAGALAVALGGGHEIAWGSFTAIAGHLAARGGLPRVGILNFDAHFDLRSPAQGANSGTPFRQIAEWCDRNGAAFDYAVLGISPMANTAALFDRARDLGVRWVEDSDCSLARLPTLCSFVDDFVAAVDVLYVSVCLDVFRAADAPGVSAPAALGIDPAVAIALIRHLGESCKRTGASWVVAEIAELNPLFDIDGRTARLGARLVCEMVDAARAANRPGGPANAAD